MEKVGPVSRDTGGTVVGTRSIDSFFTSKKCKSNSTQSNTDDDPPPQQQEDTDLAATIQNEPGDDTPTADSEGATNNDNIDGNILTDTSTTTVDNAEGLFMLRVNNIS